MAITLSEMRKGMTDKVAQQVVDLFIRKSQILEMLPFDNCVSPTGGSTLVYNYMQTEKPSTTSFRALNQEYTPNEATVTKKSAELKIFGGAFQIDRVIHEAKSKYNNLQFQIEQKVESAVGTFHDSMINGDSSSDANAFDGLDKFLVGQSTEFNTEAYIDLSTYEQLQKNANIFYEALLKLINKTGAQALLANESMITKIQTVARVLGYKTESEEAFGRVVTTIGEGKVRLVDMGNIYDVEGEEVTETEIIPIQSREVASSNVTGLTDIYAVRYSILDGFHGVTIDGDKVIRTYLPDFSQPGAVKKGEVEMVAAVALKNTKAAGVLRNVKIL